MKTFRCNRHEGCDFTFDWDGPRMTREEMYQVRRHYKTGRVDVAGEKFTCKGEGCKARVFDNVPEATAHHVAHLFADQAKELAGVVEEAVKPLVARAGEPGSLDTAPIAAAIDGLKRHSEAIGTMVSESLMNFDPVHAHVTEVLAEADRCPTCKTTLGELETRLLARNAARRPVVAREDPHADAPPAVAPPAKKPAATPLETDEELDYFALSAHGIEVEPADGGKFRLVVRDREAAEAAIAGGDLGLEKCLVAVGPDGATEYICEGAQ